MANIWFRQEMMRPETKVVAMMRLLYEDRLQERNKASTSKKASKALERAVRCGRWQVPS